MKRLPSSVKEQLIKERGRVEAIRLINFVENWYLNNIALESQPIEKVEVGQEIEVKYIKFPTTPNGKEDRSCLIQGAVVRMDSGGNRYLDVEFKRVGIDIDEWIRKENIRRGIEGEPKLILGIIENLKGLKEEGMSEKEILFRVKELEEGESAKKEKEELLKKIKEGTPIPEKEEEIEVAPATNQNFIETDGQLPSPWKEECEEHPDKIIIGIGKATKDIILEDVVVERKRKDNLKDIDKLLKGKKKKVGRPKKKKKKKTKVSPKKNRSDVLNEKSLRVARNILSNPVDENGEAIKSLGLNLHREVVPDV